MSMRRSDAFRAASTAAALEDLLDTVWRCEREWIFDDRIALATAGQPDRGRKSGPSGPIEA